MKKILLNGFILSSSFLLVVTSLNAQNLDLTTKPLYTGTTESPMMMLVMGRDHTLYYEAYNDASDLDGDGTIDIKFMPEYDYEGYFSVDACYAYNSDTFVPNQLATTTLNICGASEAPWSGNFLNYLTMTRMDVLRKVLYGGTRTVDVDGNTELERVYIPQDAHSWAKAYTSITIDGYDISNYTPYDLPGTNKAHFFGSVTYTSASSDPILRVRKNQNVSGTNAGVWDWASTERPVLKASGDNYDVRVRVCKSGILESNCQLYPNGNYKPTGLLHDYGENDDMLFGLLTGSFNKNLSGGVLRNVINKFSQELDLNSGIFNSSVEGIVSTINKLKIHGFRYSDQSYQTNCSWIANRAITEGECASWGNPIGEMLYEAMRYFSGAQAASPSYAYTDSSLGYDESLGLPAPDWDDPYSTRGTCSRPNVLLISDINPSYDSDQLPGAYSSFSSTYNGSTLSGDVNGSFDIEDLLGIISRTEGKTSGEYFIGQSGTETDGAPTVKTITGLESVRGLAPAEPTKQGSYTSAGVAYFGHNNDIHTGKLESQNINTMVVALASNLPEITVDIDGEEVKIIPYAKTVSGTYRGGTDGAEGSFQPTNTIVDWYVESISSTKGVFRINFEDVEQGADHDMDMIVTYTYEVKDNICSSYNTDKSCDAYSKGLEISLDSSYAAGSFVQHAGYIISGTTNDGMYLEVRDKATDDSEDYAYYLDTPTADYSSRKENGSTILLPYQATRNFFPSTDTAAEFLPSPLWYAAKWGGFTDLDESGTPNLSSEWDKSGADDGGADGNPDNYFPVTNAGELKDQLAAAFDLAYDGDLTGTSPAYASNLLIDGTLAYKSSFEEQSWSGDVSAYIVNSNGGYSSTPSWSAAEKLDAMNPNDRVIFTRNTSGSVFEFIEPRINSTSLVGFVLSSVNSLLGILTTDLSENQLIGLLGSTSGSYTDKAIYIQNVVSYIRGDRTKETGSLTSGLRERTSLLGDIINSTPYYVSSSKGHTVGKEVVAFAANDGMVHIVDADDGTEILAYIPSGVYSALGKLVDSAYIHEYSADGGLAAYSDENDPTDINLAGTSTEVARTTLVGRLGLGVKGLYGIDVSDLATPTAEMMRWEITPETTGFEGIGYSTVAPTIVTLKNGEASVVFANGYNSTDNDGAIYIADLTDGSLTKKLSVGTQVDPTGLNRPNAMAQPLLVDNNSDGIADYIYAGDLFGNMWVFDISSDDTDDWGIQKTGGAPLFTAISPTLKSNNIEYMPQSITTRPSVVRHPDGVGVLIAFGTGKYIESDDTSAVDQATQSFYVIEDKLGSLVSNASRSSTGFSNLKKQSIIKESSTNRLLSNNSLDWNSISGFYIDLVNTKDGNTNNYGERQVVNSTILGNKVSFVTLIPGTDPCVAGGTGWYMELNLYTGTTWNQGTEAADDPSTVEDESQDIPTDNSNKFIDGVATGLTSVASVTTSTETIINDVGDSEEVLRVESAIGLTCITLSTNKQTCFDDDLNITGPMSWRNLY